MKTAGLVVAIPRNPVVHTLGWKDGDVEGGLLEMVGASFADDVANYAFWS